MLKKHPISLSQSLFQNNAQQKRVDTVASRVQKDLASIAFSGKAQVAIEFPFDDVI